MITSECFGKTKDGRAVTRYSLSNSKGVTVKILDYGGIITDILIPDKDGKTTDITLGFDKIEAYETDSPYFGALCGRVANRIAKGKFTLEGKEYNLCVNNGPNALHGGAVGFDKKVWSVEVEEDKLKLTYVSPDGEEGYPGTLKTMVTYCLDEKSSLSINYSATTDQTTILNLTNHAYFNIAGHECGHINDNVITVNAESYLPLDETSIPTGQVKPVEGSAYDLRQPTKLGTRLSQVPGGIGFDNNFCVGEAGTLKLAARVEHRESGRWLECHTTEPGLQLYTAYYIEGLKGKAGAHYGSMSGLALEAQHYPDSIHQPSFPSVVLKPDQTYSQTTIYTFGSPYIN